MRSYAVPALALSLCSGPVGFGLAILAAANSLPEWTKEAMGLCAIVLVLGASFLFAFSSWFRLPAGAPAFQRQCATIAIVAPFLWGIAIFALAMYGLCHLDA
jgi:hypothetical protein